MTALSMNKSLKRPARITLQAPAPDGSTARAAIAGEVLLDQIVHDISQPLQALSSSVREIQVLAQDPTITQHAAAAAGYVEEIRPLLEELRDVAQAHVGGRGERVRTTYMNKLFRLLAEHFESSARAMHIRLRFQTADYRLRVDSGALRRILNILVLNAIQHSGASAVTVRAFSNGQSLLLAVRDDGSGLDEGKLERLFDPPNPLAVENEWESKRGYGLFIARLVLARLGGRLIVRTSSLGTMWAVHIPRAVDRAQLPATVNAAGGRPMQGHLIVMLDDDRRALEASSRLFDALGAKVAAFTEAVDMLAQCSRMERPPSLFILDYRLRDGTCNRTIDMLRFWLKDDFHGVVLTGDDAVSSALRELQRDVLVATKPLSDWVLNRIQSFLRGEGPLSVDPSESHSDNARA